MSIDMKFPLLLVGPDPWMAETKETFQIFTPLMFHEYIEGAGILHQTSPLLMITTTILIFPD